MLRQHLSHSYRERMSVYLSQFCRTLAISLVGIFIPAYLLTIGFTFTRIMLFLAVAYLSYGAFSPVAAKLANRFGTKKIILLSPFATIIYTAAIYGIKYYPLLLFPTALVGGFASMLFWVPITTQFIKNTNRSRAAEQSSHTHIVGKLAQMVGPLAGGLIITYMGFSLLYLISAALLFLCVVPLYLGRNHILPLKHKLTTSFTKENLQYLLVFAMQGVSAICATIIFPFYIFLNSASFKTTGFVAALIGIGTITSAAFAGKLSDRYGKHKLMRMAAVFTAIVWVAAIFLTAPIAIYTISILLGLGTVLLNMTIFALFCNKIRASKGAIVEHIIFREVGLSVGEIMLIAAMVALIPFAFKLAFALAAVSSLYFVFTRKY